ncbi:hypothetical protein [Patulibacter sp.]|uniref:hypothetical protein n=1 Tax=Patulibacter sp. TaxID=1912859 RepID=UPI002719F87C|nr:hypothetical protein [Patulibacter sp.]MDO9410106.1 hypothetical protein [Patulibacter sp.]
MTTSQDETVRGDFVEGGEDPSWDALYTALQPRTLADFFSWMGDVDLDDGTRVHVYRHSDSRSFLHVTDDGRALIYVGDEDRYRFVPLADAVLNAFVPRQHPVVPFDDAGCAALDAMYRVLCDVSDGLGIERPERDVVIRVPDDSTSAP